MKPNHPRVSLIGLKGTSVRAENKRILLKSLFGIAQLTESHWVSDEIATENLSSIVQTSFFGFTLAPADPLWAYSGAEHARIVSRLLTEVKGGGGRKFRTSLRAGNTASALFYSDAEVYQIKCYYSVLFDYPPPWVLRTRSQVTNVVQKSGGAALERLMLRCMLRIKDGLIGFPARLVLKGSRPISILLRENNACSYAQKLFAHGDLDCEILIQPSLSAKYFTHVHSRCRQITARALLDLKEDIESSMLGQLCKAAKSEVANACVVERSSFLIHHVFSDTNSIIKATCPSPASLLLFTEVDAVKVGPDRKRLVPKTPIYLSSNELQFLNAGDPVHFTLLRLQLAVKSQSQFVSAELVDVAIPFQKGSQLKTRWHQASSGTQEVPRTQGIFMFNIPSMLRETIHSFGTSQRHKLRLRQQRALVLCLIIGPPARGVLQHLLMDYQKRC